MAVSCPKVRYGPPRDGGYVILDRNFGEKGILGYGVDKDVTFENDLTAKYGIPGWVFDHTITEAPALGPNVMYIPEGITGGDEAAPLFNLATHVERFIGPVGDYMLKMDVEGAEWDVLRNSDLSRVTQLVLELHDLDICPKEVIEKLNKSFYLVHVHGNNCHNQPWYWLDRWHRIPRYLECTWVRKDLVECLGPSTEKYPTPLDVKNREDVPELEPLDFWEECNTPFSFIAPDPEQRAVLGKFVCPCDEVIAEAPGRHPNYLVLEPGDVVPLALVNDLRHLCGVRVGIATCYRRGVATLEGRVFDTNGTIERRMLGSPLHTIVGI
jgi:hypothetical protein